jgi:hypothetical protein
MLALAGMSAIDHRAFRVSRGRLEGSTAMKPVELPPEAQEQLDAFRAIEAHAHATLATFRDQLDRIRGEAAAETERGRAVLQAMIDDKVVAAELVAGAWADYETAIAQARADVLEKKARPAMAAAEEIRAKGKELARLRREVKHTRYLVALYEWHFPWLAELRDDDEMRAFLGDLSEPVEVAHDEDPVGHWVTKEEFRALPEAERNQRALDRYLTSRKAPWQLGRDYERYIGYLREQTGWTVTYHGIFEGLDDLGRDLLCRKDGRLEVVQCKRWAQHKTIHEKHVFQLFGTVVAARIEHPNAPVVGTFVTTTSLSGRAKRFARELNITVEEQVPLGDYPRIKCNIAKRSGERIYHLPFDQQYDTTVIEPTRGEMWAHTVAAAEAEGFRRAWRWRGPNY